jgi:signal recognition particle subunit SRP54
MFEFLSNKFANVFSRLAGQTQLTEKNIQETMQKVREALLGADVPDAVVETFLQEISHEVVGQKLITASLKPGEQFIKIVHSKLLAFLGGQDTSLFTFQIPSIVMMMGLQGSGKTTTTAKLARFIKKQAEQRGKTRAILVASIDFYRPAAIDQLEIVARQNDISFYRSPYTEPLKAALDIHAYYKQHGFEMLLLDTAGRMHVDTAMMQEIQHVDQKLQPKYKFLVLDAMTGQESLRVAQSFQDAVGFHGAILTKMDSETRAGCALAFRYCLKKPILFVGTGEKASDLEQFRPERVADRMLGMGDIQTLIEKADEKIKKSEQEALASSLQKGKMTLHDFAKQLEMMNKIGSLSQIMKYMPGVPLASVSSETINKGEAELKKFKAIISSMTMKERLLPNLLNASRKLRVAKGAGVVVHDVNMLLDRFEKSKEIVKLFSKFKRFPGF